MNPTRAGGGDGSGEDAIVPRVHLHHLPTGERQPLHHNPRVTMLLSNMGRLATELLAAAVRATGINAVALPVPDHGTLQLARRHVSGKECLPSHLVLGSTLQFLASEQYREDQLYLLFVPETTGPCRTGQYAVFFRNLFRDLRIPNVVLFSLGSDSSYTELGPEFTKQVWWGLGIADYMKDIETTLRVCAADPRAAMVRYDELWRGLVRIAERDARQTVPELERIAAELARIPLRRDPATCPRVLVVGEIYVRRDDFAVDQLVRLLADRGIIAKVSGITEWLYYCDFARRYELGKRLRVKPWYRRLVDREALSVVGWHIEQAYKHVSEGLIKGALSRSGLLPEGPHGMSKMVGLAERDFVSAELESEITISSGAAAAAMMEGYSGVVNISPFACLIGRVIEGLLTPWAREHSYPLLSLEIDGNTLPPSTMSKLEIFMLNVLRFRRETGLEELVEREREASVDRVIRQTAVL